MARNVVVTGVGIVSPVGIGTENTWQALLRGESGIAPITLFDANGLPCRIAGEVKGFLPEVYLDKKDIKKTGRFIQFAIAASSEAIADSGLAVTQENADRVGVHIGSGIGGFEVIEREHRKLLEQGPGRVSPFFITSAIVNLAAAQVAIRSGARGPNLASATACTTGAHAIGEAFRLIQSGDADVMICGGTEASISPLAIAGFSAMRALSTRNDNPKQASRPWDSDRDGFVSGEGAAIMILESLEHAKKRGAKILASVRGYGRNSDAYHTNAPLEDGSGVRRVMELALRDASLNPHEIAYLNAHATSTPIGDRAEAKAIFEVFGERNPSLLVGSTKSMTGHLLGAAGSLEAVITVLALRDQVIPPNVNLIHPDEAYALNYVSGHATAVKIEHAMSNSFGFGGTNASLIFGRPTE